VRPGRIVAVDLAEPVDALTAVLAADLIRATPLVCEPSWSAEQRAAVLGAVDPDLHVHDWPPAGAGAGFEVVALVGTAAPDDLAWAGFSSGSTGRPRAVVRTRASWTGSYPAVEKLTGLVSGDIVLVPGPLASSLYCFAALHGLAAGASVVVTGRWSPQLVRAYLPDTDIVHLVPHQLELALNEIESVPAPRLRTAVVGGAGMPGGLRERADAAGVSVVEYYGAVELSFVAVDTDGLGLRPFENVEIDVRPVAGSAALGEVWVRSPWLAEGYLAGAQGPFRQNDGWATVGDLADTVGGPVPERSGTQPLRLRGRGDGAVVTGGATVVPEDVEAVLNALPGVGDAVVVGTPHHRLGAVVTAVIETGGSPVRRTVLEAEARRTLAPAQRPRRWYRTDRLPRTPGGKPARALIAEALTDAGTGSPGADIRPMR
jgi:long-chain acyl-CoA synthetase